MDLRSVITVLPCDGLGDFPTHLTERDSATVLHSWTAAWRPELLAATKRLPRVGSAYSPPAVENISGAVLIIPPLSDTRELASWREELAADSESTIQLVEGFEHRDKIIADLAARGLTLTPTGDRWAPEFYALGYAFVQAELLTRALSTGSIISLDELEQRAVSAAQGAVAGDDQQAEAGLRGVYDLLEQARDHSFAVRTYLLDLVLLSDPTRGAGLQQELDEPSPKSYLLTPELCDQLTDAPTVSARLNGECLVATCGDHQLTSLSPAAARRRVQQAVDAVAQHYPNGRPAFAQTHGGVPPRLSAIAKECDAAGLLVAPLDGVRPPAVEERRFAWQNADGEHTETLALAPHNAASAGALLGLGAQLSESLYRDAVSTELFAAWAGHRHELFDDLRRVATRSTLLGRLLTVDQYFSDTLGVAPISVVSDDQLAVFAPSAPSAPRNEEVLAGMAEYAEALVGLDGGPGDVCRSDAGASELATRIGRSVARVKPAGGKPEIRPEGTPEVQPEGRIVVNDRSYSAVVLLGKCVEVGRPCDLTSATLVPDVPALGYRVIGPSDPPTLAKNAPPRATSDGLQNEFFQVLIDPETGGVRSFRTQTKRSNRLSQRIGVRRGPRRVDLPIRVERDEARVLACSADRGATSVAGRLFDLKGGLIARFEQRYYLLARCNRLYVDILLDTTDATTTLDDLCLTSRVALPEEDWLISRGVQWTRLPTHRSSFAATDYVHAAAAEGSVTLAGDRFSEHIRFGGRMLDSLLTREPAGRSFHRLAFGLDEPRPLRVTLDLRSQYAAAAEAGCAAAIGESGWLAHLDCGNVQASRLTTKPLDTGALGLQIDLVETEGRSADVRVRLAKYPKAAFWIAAGGQRGGMLDLVGEAVVVPLSAYESRRIELTW
ncbi:hypothetical protein Pla123a_38930 [Posidoniimonas polymericola]|uniref:Glycoside hydrolase family 38 N-terminal domain-containing protein n=1 Tax=Posidoniimonas polymericola TaxID=2528002 RepID=A0A5C5YCW6_9BACT|nr:hypothetical protein [Posidoniimonas polymericola]TWT73557.1 hypothetical protein Pla123a_38930 [Posidoniimonas polymericola]